MRDAVREVMLNTHSSAKPILRIPTRKRIANVVYRRSCVSPPSARAVSRAVNSVVRGSNEEGRVIK